MYHLGHPALPSLSCDLCDWFAGSTAALQTHLASQHSEDMFGCQASPACRQIFLTVGELRHHLTSSHHHQTFDCVKLVKAGRVRLPRDLRLARCVQCRASLYTQAARAGHGCGAGLSYECRACERYQLASVEKLETHINLRHGSWAVKTVQGSLVELSFTAFDLEPGRRTGRGGCYDSLRSGGGENENRAMVDDYFQDY